MKSLTIGVGSGKDGLWKRWLRDYFVQAPQSYKNVSDVVDTCESSFGCLAGPTWLLCMSFHRPCCWDKQKSNQTETYCSHQRLS